MHSTVKCLGICSVVQGKVEIYGTPFMAKSLSFVGELLGTKPYYRVQLLLSHGKILEELKRLNGGWQGEEPFKAAVAVDHQGAA